MKYLLLVSLCFIASQAYTNQDCNTCTNGYQCCNNTACCGGGNECCETKSSCCNDTCCTADESCCLDPKQGSICCIIETTFCCAPDGINPSRCCPRWTVCCLGGRYGCCDPGEENLEVGSPFAPMTKAFRKDPIRFLKTTQAPPLAIDTTKSVAIFEIPDWSGDTPMYGLDISLVDGTKTETPITGPYNDFGELTRLFIFDPARVLFYLLQANFTTPPQPNDPSRVITLYTFNPSGTVTSKIVSGAVDQVTGYDYFRKGGFIIFSTYAYQDNNHVGYNFYAMDPTTAVARKISYHAFPSGKDDYVGWFHKVSLDGTKVYRLGYEDVVHSLNPGLGVTDISKSTTTTVWNTNLPLPSGYGWYITLNFFGDSFLSLAPEQSIISEQNLDLIQWSLNGDAKVIAQLTNAHMTPYYGPVGDYINTNQTAYAAIVVADSWDSNYDRWALVVTDLKTLAAVEYDISPWMIAGTDSLSGFGIPDN